MFGNLVDVVVLPAAGASAAGLELLTEVPADFVQALVRQRHPLGAATMYITLSFEYGRGFSGAGKDVFNQDKIIAPQIDHPDGPGALNNFLHPVLRLHELAAGRNVTQLDQSAPEDVIKAIAPIARAKQARLDLGKIKPRLATTAQLLLAASAAGITREEITQVLCPEDPHMARSVCFEHNVKSTHHAIESVRLEW